MIEAKTNYYQLFCNDGMKVFARFVCVMLSNFIYFCVFFAAFGNIILALILSILTKTRSNIATTVRFINYIILYKNNNCWTGFRCHNVSS